MSTLTKSYTFSASTTIVSSQVNQNFDEIVSFCNNNVVHLDGTKTMTGILVLPASDPTTANQATRKSYVDAKAASEASAAASTTGATRVSHATALTGTSALVGTYAGQNWVMRAGYNSGNTDASGDIGITWSALTGVIAVTATLVGDFSNQLQSACLVRGVSTTGMLVRLYDPETGASRTTSPIQVTWTAVGW